MKWMSQAHNDAKLEARRSFAIQKHQEERQHVKQLQQNDVATGNQPGASEPRAPIHFIPVNGMKFQVAKGGSKLLKPTGMYSLVL